MEHGDLRLARERLENDGEVTVLAVKDGHYLGGAHGTGLAPLMQLVSRLGDRLQGAAVADRVVGLAAAFVLIHAGVTGVYGEMLSQEAQDRLQSAGIAAWGGMLVPYILRPDGQERCLLEQQVQHVQHAAQAVARLEQFLATRP